MVCYGSIMKNHITFKKMQFYFLFTLIIFILTNSLIVSVSIPDNISNTNTSTNYTGIRDKWTTNFTSLTLSLDQDFFTVDAGQTYKLSGSVLGDFLSPNVTSVSAIRLDLRLNYFSGIVNFHSIYFGSITNNDTTVTGSTNLTIPYMLNTTYKSGTSSLATFQYNLNYYIFLNDNHIYNVTSDWYGFIVTTIKNLSVISTNSTNSTNSFQNFLLPLAIGSLLVIGLVFIASLYFVNRKRRNDAENKLIISTLNNNLVKQTIGIRDPPSQSENSNQNYFSTNTNSSISISSGPLKTQKQVTQAIPKFLCPNCKNLIKKSSQFCPECGVIIIRCNICKLTIEKEIEIIKCPN